VARTSYGLTENGIHARATSATDCASHLTPPPPQSQRLAGPRERHAPSRIPEVPFRARKATTLGGIWIAHSGYGSPAVIQMMRSASSGSRLALAAAGGSGLLADTLTRGRKDGLEPVFDQVERLVGQGVEVVPAR
jgi:hypothetical protein